MRKQILTAAAALCMTATAVAHELSVQNGEIPLGEATRIYVEAGLNFPANLIEDVVDNTLKGQRCVSSNYGAQPWSEVLVRGRKNIACIATFGNETAMIIIDTAQAGVVQTIALAGKLVQKVGQGGEEVAKVGEDIFTWGKDNLDYNLDFCKMYADEFTIIPCALTTGVVQNVLPGGALALGGSVYALGQAVHGLGDGVYFVTNELGSRINIVIDNAQNAERKVLQATINATMFDAENMIKNDLAAVAAVAGAVSAVLPMSLERQSKIQGEVNASLEEGKVNIKFE